MWGRREPVVAVEKMEACGAFGPAAIGLGIWCGQSMARRTLEFTTGWASLCFQPGGPVQMAGSVHWWAALCTGLAHKKYN
jgi:hypothetical protein